MSASNSQKAKKRRKVKPRKMSRAMHEKLQQPSAIRVQEPGVGMV